MSSNHPLLGDMDVIDELKGTSEGTDFGLKWFCHRCQDFRGECTGPEKGCPDCEGGWNNTNPGDGRKGAWPPFWEVCASG